MQHISQNELIFVLFCKFYDSSVVFKSLIQNHVYKIQ